MTGVSQDTLIIILPYIVQQTAVHRHQYRPHAERCRSRSHGSERSHGMRGSSVPRRRAPHCVARAPLSALARRALRLTRAHASPAQRPTRAWAASLARTGRSPTVDATSRSSPPRLGRRARVQCPRTPCTLCHLLDFVPCACATRTQCQSTYVSHSNARRRSFGRARTVAQNCSSTSVANLRVIPSYLSRARRQGAPHACARTGCMLILKGYARAKEALPHAC